MKELIDGVRFIILLSMTHVCVTLTSFPHLPDTELLEGKKKDNLTSKSLFLYKML